MDFKHKQNIFYKSTIGDMNVVISYNDPKVNMNDVRKCLVTLGEQSFQLLFDERFNEIDFIYNDNPDDPFKYSNVIAKYLKFKFEQLKSTDFRYGKSDWVENTKNIKLEDYINFLKKENRELIIDNILC